MRKRTGGVEGGWGNDGAVLRKARGGGDMELGFQLSRGHRGGLSGRAGNKVRSSPQG